MAPPGEGDVRLVPLINATSESATCDAVHQGVVQIFLDGVWGLLCTSISSQNQEETGFDIDAKVICGQLGFQFGTRFDPRSAGGFGVPEGVYDYDYGDAFSPNPADIPPLDDIPVFATRITCTGKESRVDECVFPQREPPDVSLGPAPAPINIGISAVCEREQGTRLAVVCQQFEIQGEPHICCCMMAFHVETNIPESPEWWQQSLLKYQKEWTCFALIVITRHGTCVRTKSHELHRGCFTFALVLHTLVATTQADGP